LEEEINTVDSSTTAVVIVRDYQCFYDLKKAFDSVEYCIHLHHLYRSGINGKAWRMIRSFYRLHK
jgi:hypothetical protein